MFDASYWLVFFSAALMLNLSPGPDLVYIASRTIAHGTRVGLASAAGVCTGALVHVLAAAVGLSAFLTTSPLAFDIAKYIGAVYLIYLGVGSLRSKGTIFSTTSNDRQVSAWQAFKQGILVDALNPKVAIFFMAFLPQFVRTGYGNVTSQLIGLGLLVILVAIIVESAFVLTASRSTAFFQHNPNASVILDRLLGLVMVGLGVRLASF